MNYESKAFVAFRGCTTCPPAHRGNAPIHRCWRWHQQVVAFELNVSQGREEEEREQRSREGKEEGAVNTHRHVQRQTHQTKRKLVRGKKK